jgi:hypothetical protein
MQMANVECDRLPTVEERRRCEQRHARLMFGAAFPIFLVVAALARLMPRSMRSSMAGFDGRQSLFKEAKNAASMCIPFAFR